MNAIRNVATVRFGGEGVIGVLRRQGKREWVDWPDGGSDAVLRDTRGWPWDEHGDTDFPIHRGSAQGTRLHIVSRRRRDVWAALATLPTVSL